jgi:tetratricopeptide (TPR) repeat protein
MRRRVLGEEHPDTLWSGADLGYSLLSQGRYAEAATLFRQVLALRRKALGEEHRDTLISKDQLAWVYEQQERYDEAEALRREIVEIRKTLLDTRPGDHENQHQLIHAYQRLGDMLEQQGSVADARNCDHELKDYVKSFVQHGELSADVLNCSAMALLTWVGHDLREPVTALEFAKKAIKARKEPDPNFLDTLALAQQMNGDVETAIETQTKAVALLAPGPSALRSELESNLVKYLLEGQRFAQAEPLLLAMHEQLVESPPRWDESPSKTQTSIERLAKFYESWHAAEPDKGYDTKAAAWRAKLPPAEEAAEPAP